MKIELNENEHGIDITLFPEDIKELTQLLRFSKNAKLEKPHIFMSFFNEPYLYINMKKVKRQVQENSIKPQDRNNK